MSGLGVYQELAIGIALISSGAALVAESLCRGQEKRSRRKSEGQIGNSGLRLDDPRQMNPRQAWHFSTKR